MKKDIVTVLCYNKEKQYTRAEALKEFREGMIYCDGSERDRYTSVYLGLEAGLSYVDDEWAWQDAS